MNRAEALEQIVTFGTDIDKAYSELVKYSYDSDIEYFSVSPLILLQVLELYLTEQITVDDLEDWANFIECRDDLDYEEIEDYIYSLANPILVGEINQSRIAKMVEALYHPKGMN